MLQNSSGTPFGCELAKAVRRPATNQLFEKPERNPAQLVVLLGRNSFRAAAWPLKKKAAVRPPFIYNLSFSLS